MAPLSERLIADPLVSLEIPFCDLFTLSRDEIEQVHLRGAQRSFALLRPQLAVLDKLATDQGIDEIRTLDDLAPLLFPHTVYKSYPVSYVERNRFDRMTKWLQSLTTADLSSVQAEGIDSIDGWLDELDRSSELRVFHTSGTSGKLSFLPRTVEAWRQCLQLSAAGIRDFFGPGSGPDVLSGELPIIFPGYRFGASNAIRGVGLHAQFTGMGSDDLLYLYPDARMSADVAALSGRLRVAESRGEAGSIEISPALMKRRDEIQALELDRPNQLNKFFAEAERRYSGRDVYITAMWPNLYEWAAGGLERGYRKTFGEGSVALTGGGSKGTVLPDDWRERVVEFLGFDRMYEMYGSSEVLQICYLCEGGNYHFPVSCIPFVLDPATGAPLPRTDPQRGRLAMLDTLSTCYWAAIVTGDDVTIMGWDDACSCGRTGPYLTRPIRRFSESQGGDDKINCAGAPEAHDKAMAFLAALAAE
jgi:hypothetical protein